MDGGAIPQNPFWQPKIGYLGEFVTALDELAQALNIIIQTHKGAVPLDPDFGCDLYKWMDKPEPIAKQGIIREITKAVLRCEPRITINSIKFNRSQALGQSAITISWKPTDASIDSAIQETEVTLCPA